MPKHTEDNYVDWVLRGIDRYYEARGFRVFTYSVGQPKEFDLPFDRILYVDNKIVGLQFKPPANGSSPWKYPFDAKQHEKLKKAKWIHYCLPAFVDPLLQHVALYHVHFAPTNSVNIATGEAKRFLNWGAFANGIEECPIGMRLPADKTIQDVIRHMREEPANAYIVLNRLYREAHLIRIRKDNDRNA